MSEPNRPAGPSFNAAWLLALLVVPAALFAGRLIAGLPLPAVKPAAEATAPGAPSPLVTGARGGAAAGGGEQWAGRSDADGPGPGDPQRQDPSQQEAQGGGLRWLPLAAAMEEARISGKPILFDFNADWCPPCQRMKREAFANPSLARAVESAVIPVSIVDRYREDGRNPPEIEELQQRFGIEAFPTLVVLSTTTGRFVKDAGYGGPEATRDWILGGAQQVK
jgi:thiol-disulfide isomerase/thioredoxin